MGQDFALKKLLIIVALLKINRLVVTLFKNLSLLKDLDVCVLVNEQLVKERNT